jgi:glutamate N-acetyltransferase/amino-acid N-acetyltransferase
VATTATSFRPAELGAGAAAHTINLSLLVLDQPTTAFAAVTTTNQLVGAPVTVVRAALSAAQPVQGIVINNRVANVCAVDGVASAQALLTAVAGAVDVAPESLLPASTGVIGWRLPVAELAAAAPGLRQALAATTSVDLAEAIMTTDAYPKVRSATLATGHRVLGLAKGAGMIEPHMGTMLAFLLTDAPASRSELQAILAPAVATSFNAITIDGDQSTSDMAILLSSSPRAGGAGKHGRADGLADAVKQVCAELASDLVRNGEGTRHVLRIVASHPAGDAWALAKAIGNSPLVKTAIFGNDPNVGRLAAAVGDYLGSGAGNRAAPTSPPITIQMGEHLLLRDEQMFLNARLERELHTYLEAAACDTSRGFPPHNRTVDIAVRVGETTPTTPDAEVLASDLSYDYVRENADYRS